MQRLQAHAPEMKAIQQRYKHDRAKQQEELMKFYRENKINPASSCLPILFQIPVFLALFFVLRDFEKEVFPKYPGSDSAGCSDLVPDITQPLSSDPLSAVILLILYASSQTASTLLMSSDDGQDAALPAARAAARLPLLRHQLPGRPDDLLGHDEPLDDRQGLVTRQLRPKPVQPEKRSSRTPPKDDAGDGGQAEGRASEARGRRSRRPPRRVKRKKKRARR